MKAEYVSPVVDFIEFDKSDIVTGSTCWGHGCPRPIDGVFDSGSGIGWNNLETCSAG